MNRLITYFKARLCEVRASWARASAAKHEERAAASREAARKWSARAAEYLRLLGSWMI